MFEVVYKEKTHMVYHVRTNNIITEFLIWREGKFVWVDMELCEKYEAVWL